MIALDRRRRSLFALGGALATTLGFGLIPPGVHSAASIGLGDANAPLRAQVDAILNDRGFALPVIDDPFARPLPAVPAIVRPTAIGRAPNIAGRRLPAVTLRAILLGSRKQALLEDGMTVRIVQIGDRVESGRIRKIEPSGVELDDGRRLTLEGATL